VLISVSSALDQTPVYTAGPRTWTRQCIARCACLRPNFCRGDFGQICR